MNFEAYELKETVSTGVWRTLKSGIKVKVASIRAPEYVTAKNRLQKKHADMIRAGDDETTIMVTSKAMAGTILLDWENAETKDGLPLLFSVEVAEDMLIKYEIFREEIATIAVDDDNYTQTAEK